MASSGLAGRKCATGREREAFKPRCRAICGFCLTPAAWGGRRSGFWRICLSLPERGWTGRCFWNGGQATPATRRIWNGLCCGDGWRSGRTKKFPSTRSCWIWFMESVIGGGEKRMEAGGIWRGRWQSMRRRNL